MSYGRSPPRSKRNKLLDKGYHQVTDKECPALITRSFTEVTAKNFVKGLHRKGYSAQAVFVNPFNEGGHWIVMYKKKEERKR
jgi:hypothetical protein